MHTKMAIFSTKDIIMTKKLVILMVPFFCYCLRKHKRIILFFSAETLEYFLYRKYCEFIKNFGPHPVFLFFSKLNVVKTNTTKIRIIELKHEKKKSFMNICYIVCYVRNKHRQKSVKKRRAINTNRNTD